MTGRTPLTAIIRLVPQTGGHDVASYNFRDQPLLDQLILVLDYVYDEDAEVMIEKMFEVMGDAEDRGIPKVHALRQWANRALEPHWDDIESAERGASMH